MTSCSCYRPAKNLREGNIFSRVCLADHRGCHVTITHDALNLTTQGPPLCTETQSRPHPLYRDPLVCPLPAWTCSHLFRLDLALQLPFPPSTGHVQTCLLRYYEARTVGKRAVGILLECFLVGNVTSHVQMHLGTLYNDHGTI